MNHKGIMMSEKSQFQKLTYFKMPCNYLLHNDILEMTKIIEVENRLAVTMFWGKGGWGHKIATEKICVVEALFYILTVGVDIYTHMIKLHKTKCTQK